MTTGFADRNSPMVINETERAKSERFIYATKKAFNGQRMSVGRVVLVRRDSERAEIEPATVISIDTQDNITATGAASGDKYHCAASNFDATLEETVWNLTPGCWTWPPRVSEQAPGRQPAISYTGNTA